MIDPLTIAAIRRLTIQMSRSGNEDVAELSQLVALVTDALAGAMAQSNAQLAQLLLLIESMAITNEQIHKRLRALEGDGERSSETEAGSADAEVAS